MPYKSPLVGICVAPNCSKEPQKLVCRGMCNTHYQRFMKRGCFEIIHPALGRPLTPGTKYCPQCKIELATSNFRNKSACYCKTCEKSYYERRAAVKEQRGECISCGRIAMQGVKQCYDCRRRQSAYHARFDRRAKILFKSIRGRCIDQGVTCTLTIEWLLEKLKGRCELTGLPFDLEGKRSYYKQKFNPFSPSVDRIVHGDYSPENCRMVLTAINIGINHWGEDIYGLIAKAFLRHKKQKKATKGMFLTQNLDLLLEGQVPPSVRIRRH